MRVALVQVESPSTEPIEERRARVDAMVRSAKGADLIVLPELWGVGYLEFDRYAETAEPRDGPTMEVAKSWARDLGANIHLGSFVERADQHLLNTAALISRDGAVAHTFSKLHVFGYQSEEAKHLTGGTTVSVTTTDFGPAATAICYDLRFPELWREIVDLGAEVAIVPAAWPGARLNHWRLFTSARAVEEQMVVIACNAAGRRGNERVGGHSRIVDPWGEVLVEAGPGEGIFLCDVDTSVVAAARKAFPVLEDRLPSYSDLIRPTTGAAK